mgnify:CR=1 FL=1|tara:strand:+ start:305 stop:592 length:288 start_codon:yes stop_codon:yes gene_type:complete
MSEFKIEYHDLSDEEDVRTKPMGLNIPSLLRYLKHRFQEDRMMGRTGDTVELVAKSFGIKHQVALAFLSGEVDYREEGNAVIFDWPEETIMEEGG